MYLYKHSSIFLFTTWADSESDHYQQGNPHSNVRSSGHARQKQGNLHSNVRRNMPQKWKNVRKVSVLLFFPKNTSCPCYADHDLIGRHRLEEEWNGLEFTQNAGQGKPSTSEHTTATQVKRTMHIQHFKPSDRQTDTTRRNKNTFLPYFWII